MDLNDIIKAVPTTDGKAGRNDPAHKGRIVYIHPEGRFCTIEFQYKDRAFCETRMLSEKERVAFLKEKRERRERTRKNATPPGYFALSECCKNPDDLKTD